MSFVRLNNILFEKSSVTFRKQHTYTSSSAGITGNFTIARRPSTRVRGDSKDFDINDPDKSTIMSSFNEDFTGKFSRAVLLLNSEKGLAGLDETGQDPYAFVKIREGDPATVPASEADLLIDSNGNMTAPIFAMLENIGGSNRSLRDIKYINVSASFGCNGVNLFSRPAYGTNPVFKQQINWPGVNIFDNSFNPASRYFPYGEVNKSLTAEDVPYTPSINPLVLMSEVFTNKPVVNTDAIMDFRDKVHQGYVPISNTDMEHTCHNLMRNTLAKKQITNTLMPYYAAKYNNCDFTYHNYNTLNFMHTGDYPANACLVYSGSFFPVHSNTKFTDFTFSFWINPRYTTDTPGGEFNTGTIMHVSSSMAISLVSGSSTDENGYLDGYRIMLQLSQSAESLPSSININNVESKPYGNAQLSYPNDLIYLTSDNSLKKNHWHYVSVKWSPNYMNGSGSIRIDDSVTYFPVPSASFGKPNSMIARDNTFIGNFYDGPSGEIPKFFSKENALLDAAPVNTSVASNAVPSFNIVKSHPLNAEIHELRGYSNCLTNFRETQLKNVGLTKYSTDNVKFHVPIAFSRFIRGGNDYGVMLQKNNQIPILLDYKLGTTLISPLLTGSISSLDTKTYTLAEPESNIELAHLNKLGTESRANLATYFGQSTPFNVNFSHGQGGKYLNLPNFVKNFAVQESQDTPPEFLSLGYYPMTRKGFESPRLFNLSASLANVNPNPGSARPNAELINTMEYSYSSSNPGLRKRNLMILPNDNGLFIPDYFYLEKEEIGQNRRSIRYQTDAGNTNYGIISLRSFIYNANQFLENEVKKSKSFKRVKSNIKKDYSDKIKELGAKFSNFREEDFLQNKTLESIKNSPDYKLFLHNLKALYFDAQQKNFLISSVSEDKDSNDVSIFSISSIYYGEQIHRGTFEITDNNLTGSNSKISLKFKDDMYGSLYRADCKTPHATWASVGNIFYDEGICFIKSPHAPCFGKNHHEIKFKGENTAQVLTINVPAPRDMINSSSNPSFLPVSASLLESDAGNDLVYITGVNIHDENLNVIMRANLAQPIVKRLTDEYMFKIKMDF
jgi:hypothetical protein